MLRVAAWVWFCLSTDFVDINLDLDLVDASQCAYPRELFSVVGSLGDRGADFDHSGG